MKKIKITLTKGNTTASCIHSYRRTDWPDHTEWKGDREPFARNGRLLDFSHGTEKLEETVAHQAALCGATFEMEDLGGEAMVWTDQVEE